MIRLSENEALFARRGFPPARLQKQEHLEQIGRAFIRGYNLALQRCDVHELARRVNCLGAQTTGFAFEGAAMGLALMDHLRWGPGQWREFLEGPGAFHKYMLYVGYGWAVAQLPWLRRRLATVLSRHRTIEKWLIVDGYGFHEGYFHPERSFERQQRPRRVSGDAARVFDQGLGRCFWFYCGADVERVACCVERFEPGRRADLWSGVALAVTYAGGATPSEMTELRQRAVGFEADLAQGSAFGAQARVFANLNVPHTSTATEIFCGVDAADAAAATDHALSAIHGEPGTYASYEQWRSAIRKLLPAGNEAAQQAV